MDPSKDLLAFVTALDTHSSSSSDEGDSKRVKKGRDKKKKNLERKE